MRILAENPPPILTMQGATPETDGQGGLVPAPKAGQEGYVLLGSGLWVPLTADLVTSGLAAVAKSGAYSDLSGKPSLAAVASSGSYNDLTDKPSLAAVASSGSYNDLTDKPQFVSGLSFGFDGQGAPIIAGTLGRPIQIPFACTVTGWTIMADQAGSIEFDVWKAPLASYPPNTGNSMVAANPPTLSSAAYAGGTPSNWLAIAAGDVVIASVISANTVQWAVLELTVQKA